MPKVSIIMCSHNRPEYLRMAIQSIVDQTMPDWELIVIDDCSTVAGIDEVVNKLREKDDRIKYYKMEENVNNLTVLWNFGADVSTGEYVSTCDDDTMKKPEYCRKMSEFLDKHKEFEAVACYADIWREDKFELLFDLPSQMNKENIKVKNFCDSGSIMFRRTLFDKIGWWDERMTTCDDWDFVKRIQLQTNGFGILHESLYIYRWHADNRTYMAKELGDKYNHYVIMEKKRYDGIQDVLFYHQKEAVLTLSQNNVLQGVKSALQKIPYVKLRELVSGGQNPEQIFDIVFIFSPFSLKEEEVEKISRYGKEVVSFHIEDPQAFKSSAKRDKFATYVFTNDHAVLGLYEEIVGAGRVGFCPSLSYDDINLPNKSHKVSKKKYDILFLGTAYESRKLFINELLKSEAIQKLKLAVVGEYWDGIPESIDVFREVDQKNALDLMNASKIVLLKNRVHTDLGGSVNAIKPLTVDRGYFEMASDALVMLDSSRPKHSFNDEIVFYNNISDCIDKINYYLKNKRKRDEIIKKANKRVFNSFTYQKRITKIINCVRSIRYFFEIE